MKAIGTILTYRYGTAEIIGYEGPRRVEVYRPFEVHPREPWNAAITERPFCANHDDVTPTVRSTAYDSRCSCCYLGFGHTEAKHAASIGGSR